MTNDDTTRTVRDDIAPPTTARSRSLVVKAIPSSAFRNQQLDLFQHFLVNTDAQREALSNAIELWDSIPRYSISRAKQDNLRTKDGMLPIRKLEFQHRGKAYIAQIRPARIEARDEDSALTGQTIEYYPSAREELIEHALRKLATEQNSGFWDEASYRSGVTFSLHQLRGELAARGHAMKYMDIVEGLDIMNLANLRLIDKASDQKDPTLVSQAYLPALLKVSKAGLASDPDARWVVQFHGALTAGIDRITYRQFNYQRLMSCRSQLSRWLLSQLVVKYTQAAIGNTFTMLYSAVKRDSGLLNYAQQTRAVEALDEALDEVKTEGVLAHVKKEVRRGARGKIEEVTYQLIPSPHFAREQKAANKRLQDARQQDPSQRTPVDN